jgi:hypothetical protein
MSTLVHALGAALTTPVNVRLGGIALALAAAVGSWQLAVVAAAAYLLLAGIDLASPDFRARTRGERPTRPGG